MTILLTRPLETGLATKTALEAIGFEVLWEPLLAVEQLATAFPIHKGGSIDGIILSSVNAVEALERAPVSKATPIFVTGQATAQAARRAGYQNIALHEGSVDALIAALPDTLGLVLYPCAETTAHDVEDLLACRKMASLVWPVYRTIEKQQFSEEAKKGLQRGVLGVLLYSPRTARCFARLMAGIEGRPSPIFCFSAAIAEALPKSIAAHASYPPRPNEEVFLQMIAEQTD